MNAVPVFDLKKLPPLLDDLDIPNWTSFRGKVRRNFFIDENQMLMVTMDAISAHDVNMRKGIPGRGKILNGMSLFWNQKLHELLGPDSFQYHLIDASPTVYRQLMGDYLPQMTGRTMLVERGIPLPIESIVRGYLAGSGYAEYLRSQTVCGISLPTGLVNSSPLHEPIWTPSTKAPGGEHDINISEDQAVDVIARWLREMELNLDPVIVTQQVKNQSLMLYTAAAKYAHSKGIIIADTKFEFILGPDGLTLSDEVLTSDSSRYWDLDLYSPGKTQASYDKQLLRDYLDLLVNYGLWDKKAPAPVIPDDIVDATARMYLTAFWKLTGVNLAA